MYKSGRNRAILALCAVAAVALLVFAGASAAHHGGGDNNRGWHGWKHGKFSAYDEQYLTSAIEGDRFEIEGGKVALKNASNQKVKDLAQRLITDHTKSLNDAIELAKKYRMDIPSDPSPPEQWEIDEVAGLSGDTFDKRYTLLEVADHEQDISEASDEVKHGSARRVRKTARDEIPTLQEHLQLSQEAYDAVK